MKKKVLAVGLALAMAMLPLPGLQPVAAAPLGAQSGNAQGKGGETFQIRETTAGAAAVYTGVLAGRLSAVSAIDIMCSPSGIAAAADGSLLVTDTYNKVIRVIKNGKSSVYAGGETVTDLYGQPLGGYNDASVADSYFSQPWAIAPFLDGWAVSDAENNAVRLIHTQAVETVNGKDVKKGAAGKPVKFNHPTGLATDGEGNLYVADTFNGVIRVVSPEGASAVYASGLSSPMGLCWRDGTLYVAEAGANRIVRIVDGKAVLVAGSGTGALADGPAAQAAFSSPQDVTAGEDGALYVSDTGNSAIRKISGGEVTTLIARDRSAAGFGLVSPTGLLVQGNQLYICDPFSRKLFLLSLS